MKSILFFILTQLSISICQSQSINWNNYLPQQQIDSIVFLSTNKSGPRVLTKKDSSSMSQKELQAVEILNQKIQTCFHSNQFPTNNYSEYLEVYEIKQQVSTLKEIAPLMELFPHTKCTSLAGDRCPPQFRDCVLFFNKGKLVYVLKICFDCDYIYSTPDTYEAKCLANIEPISKIMKEWITRGLIDLYERQ